MMLSTPAAGLLLILAWIYPSHALYFHIGETEKNASLRKFQMRPWLLESTGLSCGTNRPVPSSHPLLDLGCMSRSRIQIQKIILSRQYGSDGRFTFTSHTPGEHQICLHSNSTKMALFAGGKLRVHLDIQVGEHTNNYPEIAAKDKLTELQLRVRQLLDQVEQIQKEQNYQRYREERFRMTSESTNQRVLWWSIAQTLILIVTGIWQMKHLKSFFEAKKLV
uniref:Transmembrane p24 trafficking protein 4 n=1 Tax=Lates calcarifer TaxID=8187 RepID=A0A4W6BY93_LATCA